jgi:cytosine/adenosine deaminase-related metal-dependent hydrolase
MNRTLLKNGVVFTQEGDDSANAFRKADVLIEGQKIAAIRDEITADDCEVIDAKGMLVLPGFVDTHRHLWETSLRGVAGDWSLMQYFTHVLGALAPAMQPEDVYTGTLLGALEALNAGVTTVFDWSHISNTPEHADAAVAALFTSGIRAIYGHGTPGTDVNQWFMESKLPHPEDARRIRTQYFSSDQQLVTMGLAIRGPEYSTLEVSRHDVQLGRELGVMISMHAGGGTFGKRYEPVRKLKEAGLLGPDLNFAHGNSFSGQDLQWLTDYGCSLAVTPEVEMQMGIGWPVLGSALRKGVRTGLGVDVVAGVGGDMFAQMRIGLQTQRALDNQPYLDKGEMPGEISMTCKDALNLATLEGAKVLGLHHKTGSLRPGKQADMILVDTHSINMHPVDDPSVNLVLHAHPGNIDSVFVAGKAVKRHGRLLDADLDQLRRKAGASRTYLLEKAGLYATAASS